MKVAVIAGTPVDTRMGVEYIEKKNAEIGSQVCEPIYLPVADSCDEQLRFQYADTDKKRAKLDEIFEAAIRDGIRDFFIYCNSLAGAFDFEDYMDEKSREVEGGIRIYTPLQVYRDMGKTYKCAGVLAAHNLSAAAIEEALMSANSDIYVIGTGNMSVVKAIEDGLEPEKIVEDSGLGDMASYMKASGAETIILGCTHFPYIKDELEKYCDIPITDPADEMFEALLSVIQDR